MVYYVLAALTDVGTVYTSAISVEVGLQTATVVNTRIRSSALPCGECRALQFDIVVFSTTQQGATWLDLVIRFAIERDANR